MDKRSVEFKYPVDGQTELLNWNPRKRVTAPWLGGPVTVNMVCHLQCTGRRQPPPPNWKDGGGGWGGTVILRFEVERI